MRHVPQLDGIRGIAILLVLFHHCTIIEPHSATETLLVRTAFLGCHGVDLFFVLSGFLITGILLDQRGSERYLLNFYIRRALRLFPLYYLLVAFCFLVLPLLAQQSAYATAKFARAEAVINDWPYYVTYLSNVAIAKAGMWRHAILDISWSLAIEEQFYIVWALTVFFCSQQVLKRICQSTIIGSLILRIALLLAGKSWLSIYVGTLTRMDALAWGCLLAIIVREATYNTQFLRRLSHYGLGLASLLVIGLFSLPNLGWESPLWITLGFSIFGLLSVSIVANVMTEEKGRLTRWCSVSWLRFFGKYSYSIYLLHFPVRGIIRDKFFSGGNFETWPLQPLFWQCVFYSVTVMVIIPIALLSWYLIEAPCLEMKRYFDPNLRNSRKKAASLEPAKET